MVRKSPRQDNVSSHEMSYPQVCIEPGDGDELVFTVDSEAHNLYDLPLRAQESVDHFKSQKTSDIKPVYSCDGCGYLTQAQVRSSCTKCDSTEFTNVYPFPDDETNYVEVPALTEKDVPNNPAHLTRIQNQFTQIISTPELLWEVKLAIKEYREVFSPYR